MQTSKYILPYKSASKSANALAEAMGVPLLGVDMKLLKGGPNKMIINWGKGDVDSTIRACGRIINKPEAICIATNKIKTFELLKSRNVSTPEFTTSKSVAQSWLNAGHKVCIRTTVEGKDGEGLHLADGTRTDWFGRPLPLPDAPLYTKLIKAKAEYRINVCNDRTMGVQLKVPTGANPHAIIKTGGNGYGFRLLAEGEIPTGIRPVARDAIRGLGLDFGGVDLIVGVDGRAYVLEVNTAPELTPAMVTAYANMFSSM